MQNEALLTECSSTLRQTVTLAVVVLLLLALRLPELFSAPLYSLAEGHALAPPPKPRSPQPPTPCAPNNTAKDAPAGASFFSFGFTLPAAAQGSANRQAV